MNATNRNLFILSAIGLVACLVLASRDRPAVPATQPAPVLVPLDPEGPSKPKPKKPRCPNCPSGTGAAAPAPRAPVLGGLQSPDGLCAALPLPEDWQPPANIASRGLGCCAFRALDYAARWQHAPELCQLPEKMRSDGVAGGGWPEKVDQICLKYAPGCAWYNATRAPLELLCAVLASGRLACVDYSGHDPHYRGSIAHCVNVVACDLEKDWVAILDNNYPKMDDIVWMGTAEFRKRWSGWLYGPLAATPGSLYECDSDPEDPSQVDPSGAVTFGLVRARRIDARGTTLNGRAADLAAVTAAIGPAMVPAINPHIDIDHKVDVRSSAESIAPFAIILVGIWAARELLKGDRK